MTVVVYLAAYAGLLAFIIASVARAVQLARLPRHLRWELYPVPHEEPRRVAHGGSYFEQPDWWTRPRRYGLLGELEAMLAEMLFLRGLWHFNRSLWWRSFPFHFGLYLLAGAGLLVSLSALTVVLFPAPLAASLTWLVRGLYVGAGGAGWVLTTVGAGALLHRRLTDAATRAYTVPADVFNLVAFIGVLSTVGVGLTLDRGPGVRAIAAGLLTFDRSLSIPWLLAVGLVLGAALIAYIPLTHMSHFIGKYFTYHAVRWDDRAIVRGASSEARVAEYLAYRPTWAAAHLGADGTKDWRGVATGSPADGAQK